MGLKVCHENAMEVFDVYQREAVAMLQPPGVSVSKIAVELGIETNGLGYWRLKYGWLNRPPSARAKEYARLLERIRHLHADHDGVVEACGSGKTCVMPGSGVAAIEWRDWCAEPDYTACRSIGSGCSHNTKWVTDITCIRTVEHWLYLCVVLDLYSGLVVCWSMSPHQDRQLVDQAVLMALWQRSVRTSVILHSDRGCQFTSDEYQRFLEAHQVIYSMIVVGSCADNAPAESFFEALKRERVNHQHYPSRGQDRYL